MYKARFWMVLAILILAGLASSCTTGAARVKLQFAPEVGKTYHVKMTTDQAISQTIEGQEMMVNQTMGLGFTAQAAQKDENGNVWLDIVYDWVQMKQSSPAGETEYDSSNPSEVQPFQLGFKALVGKGFSFRASPTGEVLELRGVSEMISAILNEINTAGAQQFASSIQEQYNAQAMKDQMESVLAEFPQQPVKIGDTWTSRVTTAGFLPLITENTYTLQAYKDGIATVHAASKVQTDPQASPTVAETYQIKYTLSGTQSGDIALDAATGWSTSATLTQTLSGQVAVNEAGQDYTIPMSINTIIRLEMVER